jgi:hypothetical protein
VAGRDRDWDFARVALKAGLVEIDQLLLRVMDLPIDRSDQMRLRRMLEGIAGKLDLG